MQTIYGLHAVQSMLKHQPQQIITLFIDEKRQDKRLQQIIDLAHNQGVRINTSSKKSLDQKSGLERHQGVVIEAKANNEQLPLKQFLKQLKSNALLLILDGITDPHNLGACLRTADAAGVDAVIIPKDKSASITSTVRKVACGAAEVIPLYEVTNLARTLEELQQAGIWIFGTAGEADNEIYQVDLTGPAAIVMGAEEKGMRRLTREHCDHLIKLPMLGTVSSLNVSVATGICLFEVVRQRQS